MKIDINGNRYTKLYTNGRIQTCSLIQGPRLIIIPGLFFLSSYVQNDIRCTEICTLKQNRLDKLHNRKMDVENKEN